MSARLDALHDEDVGPGFAARRASSTSVTVTHTVLPTACRRATTSAGGQPKVKETAATGVVLEQHELGVPRVVFEVGLAERDALAPGLVAQRLDVALVAPARVGRPGTKTLTPKGAPVSARVAPMSSRSA
jgi:hypothetical protein